MPWRRSPILLHYYITYRCNCTCRFCDIWRTDGYDCSLTADLKDVDSNLAQAKKLGVRFVDFTGGEPLLHPELPDMLASAQKLGFKTSITTNGLLYTDQAKTLQGKVDLLHFSLDSLDPQQHNAQRGKQVFEAVMTALNTALSLGETPDLLFTVTPHNLDQLPLLVRFAQKLKIMLIVNPVFTHIRQQSLSESDLNKIERYRGTPYVYINRAMLKLRRQGGNDRSNPRCRVTDSTIVISPDNHLLRPCFHHYRKELPINGDLYHMAQTDKNSSMDGRYEFCQGCVLNCYMDPSFLYKIDSLFLASLLPKAHYAWYKYMARPVSQAISRKLPDAAILAASIREQYR